jgi:hypothetical protein
MRDRRMMTYWADNNVAEAHEGNAFINPRPQLAHVFCEPPTCPFTADEVALLDEFLAAQFTLTSQNMEIRRTVWIAALSFSTNLFAYNYPGT